MHPKLGIITRHKFMSDKKYAPYPPAANLLTAIRTFRERGFTGRVTVEVLESIGVPEGNAYRVLAALKWLGLLNADGSTSEQMDAVRTAPTEQYPVLLEGLVRNAYGEIFQYCNPAVDDATRISDAFRTFSPPIQRPKMVTAFLALCKEAGIIGGEPPQSMLTNRLRRKTQPVQRGRADRPVPPPAPAPTPVLFPSSTRSVEERLLDKFPDFDPSWSEELKTKWFTDFSALRSALLEKPG